jgi:hypothetical protein
MPGSLKKLGFPKVPSHIFQFLCFVLTTGFVFTCVIGMKFDWDKTLWFGALQLEILGLVLVRSKIKSRNSVSGISGATFIMYAMVYFSRTMLHITHSDVRSIVQHNHTWDTNKISQWLKIFDEDFQLKDLDFDAILGLCSLLLVLDILASIFATHRKTYEDQLDKLKAWYVIPACLIMALVVRPHFRRWNFMYGYCWGATMYMDMLALMPQVAMMAISHNKVETPIADFVFLTSISRCSDLWHSLFSNELRKQQPFMFLLARLLDKGAIHSERVAIIPQIVNLLLVADFGYYFCKARAASFKRARELTLSLDTV